MSVSQNAEGTAATGPETGQERDMQDDQDTMKVGKCISSALSKVSATGFTHPPSSATPTLDETSFRNF